MSIDIEQFFQQIAASEPKEMKGSLVIPSNDRPYAQGTTVPLLGRWWIQIRVGLGKLLIPASTQGPQPIDYIHTYMTLDQYIDLKWTTPSLQEGLLSNIIDQLLLEHSPADLMRGLAFLNHVRSNEQLMDNLATHCAAGLSYMPRARFINALNHARRNRTHIVARQPLLHAMRAVMTRSTTRQPKQQLSLLATCVFLGAPGFLFSMTSVCRRCPVPRLKTSLR